jgi:hypothetical protein
MAIALVGFLWVLNLGISIFNAVVVGKGWVEAKHAGGWPRFMAWMVAIMAASGFTWCISIPLGAAAHLLGWLDARHLQLFFETSYIVIVPFVLFSGMAITIQSWARAYRGSIADKGVAVYNTFAQAYNTYQAVSTFGDAFGDVFGSFADSLTKDDDSGAGAMALLVLVLVAFAAGGGILITMMIIKHYAAAGERMPLKPRERMA